VNAAVNAAVDATMNAAPATRRRWQAPEVVQTSAMDCGPATLKCVLEGFRIPVSYGRLREACQTDVDGTSIDTLEGVAQQLGVAAEQVLIPADHVLQPGTGVLPAIAVVRLPDGAAHFVVAWRRVGAWLQVMDPATGRRWMPAADFARALHRHELVVPEADWRAWAAGDEFQRPLRQRLAEAGVPPATAQALCSEAVADAGWFGLGLLDATLRLVQSLVDAGGVRTGTEATRLLQALCARCRSQPNDIHATVPAAWWSVTPDPASARLGTLQLTLRGAVLLRVPSRLAHPGGAGDAAPLSTELQAALKERPPHPLRTVWRLVRQDGLLAPAALAGAMVVAGGAIVVEAMLLRGVFDVALLLGLPQQRLAALGALLLFAALVLALEVPIVRESMRHGRHLELRLRQALLAKLPRLPDRYFHSRSVSDMAERSHGLQAVRQAPALGMNLVQVAAELAVTLLGVCLLAPASAGWALALVALVLALPLLLQPLLGERDLLLRNQSAALHGSFLDALLGLVPVRTHHGEVVVRRRHEGLLVDWVRASRGLLRLGIAAEATRSLLATALSAALLWTHFSQRGSAGGSDLLLVYWVLKLPALGGGLAHLLQAWPGQRNVLLRLLEPLAAPEAPISAATTHAVAPQPASQAGGVDLRIEAGHVVAAGHDILRDVDLHVAAGEHVAIVGSSGAGKSTLLGLLLGWHRLARGRLQVDGHELDAGAQDTLRRQTAWVDPAVQLWNRSLADNLGYACADGGLARLDGAMEASGLRPVLHKLPQGLQTPLGEGGALLSGGEGQRVRLARALLQTGVRLVLLDEPFRGLDRGQRGHLLQRARRRWLGTTLLCVTHDVAETQGFDRVLVVEDGRIVEDGPPGVLAAGATRYAELLQAEHALHATLWQGALWRRLRVQGGRVVEDSTPGPA